MADLRIILGALTPIFVLIVLGAVLHRGGFPGASFWPQVERFTYYVLFPALLVESLATAEVDAARIAPVALAVVATLAAVTLLLLGLRRALPVDAPGFTSVYQGAIRFNTFVGMAIAFGVYGPEGGAVAALVMAVMIPLLNVLCVAVLGHYVGGFTTPAALVGGMARNPLILACLAGIILNRTGIGLPWGSADIMEIVGRAALPLGLMTVGAGLRLGAAQGRSGVVAATSLLKLAVVPGLAWAIGTALRLQPLEMQILVMFSALPTATAAYILARQMGGDHTLIATILTTQTALSAMTLPLWLLAVGTG